MTDTRRGTSHPLHHLVRYVPFALNISPHNSNFSYLEIILAPNNHVIFSFFIWFYNPPVLFHQPKHYEGLNRCATSSSSGMAGQGRRCGIGLSFALSLSLYVNFALNFALKLPIALVIILTMTVRSNCSQKHLTPHFCPCEGSQPARLTHLSSNNSTEPHLLCLSLVFREDISASFIQLPCVQSLMNRNRVTAYG